LLAVIVAVVFLVGIVGVTVLFVCLYKYRCMKIIFGWLITACLIMLAMFGGIFLYMFFEVLNWPIDVITYVFFLWNFAVAGVVSVFYVAHIKVNQAYLILISGLLAVLFSLMPDWTTFAILAIVAVYDLFAVLCPRGPLKVLVETAQQRQEPIPALLYNASVFIMMTQGPDQTNEKNDKKEIKKHDEIKVEDKKEDEIRVEEKKKEDKKPADDEDEDIPKRHGIKLGLGDFVFYSVLIGRAALLDMIAVFTCFVGIVTGLFCTLILLAIFRKALPALPISIGLGIIFYVATKYLLLPFVIVLGANQAFV